MRTVGIVGGYGAVGRVVASALRRWQVAELRIGGRHMDEARALAAGLGAEASTVDVSDPVSLAGFCAGCAVVVNCAGPSYRVLDSVARAAAGAGADYVDAGGDDPVYERMAHAALPGVGRVAVLSAGMAPGLTGLLPRWLATHGFTHLDRLVSYVAARDRFTPAAAGDYLLSLGNGYGEPMAAWSDGRLAPRALEPLREVELPFFSGPVTAYPYLSTETRRLAVELGIAEVHWYNVFDTDGQMLAAMSRVRAQYEMDGDLAAAVVELGRVADLDLFGRGPRQQFVMRMDGWAGEVPVTRTAVLRAAGTYHLTGVLTAVAVREILRGAVPPGLHYAAEVLAPEPAMAEIGRADGVAALDVVAGEVAAAAVEEGVL